MGLRSEFLNAALMQTIPDLEGTEIILETTGNPGVLLRHGVLLVSGAPCQLQSLAGQEHGPDHPIRARCFYTETYPEFLR